MFDLGWTELMLIGIVALIVVGPKDLPGMFRAVGKFVGKAKGMAREFSQAMNDAADDAGVSDVSKTLKQATNPLGSAMDEVKKSTESFTQQTMNSGKPKLSPEREELAEKIRKRTAETATKRKSTEVDKETAQAKAEKAPKAPSAKKTAAKKPATKTTAAKKTAATKPAAKKATATKATSKSPAKKPAAKKPAAKKAPAKKPAEDKA